MWEEMDICQLLIDWKNEKKVTGWDLLTASQFDNVFILDYNACKF